MEGGDLYDEQKEGDGGCLRNPTEMGAKRRGDPWNVRRQVGSRRKETTHWTRYGLTPFLRRRERSEGDSTLSKPPFTSRKRVETL